MIGSDKSVQYFGIYLLVEGALLILFPHFILGIFLLNALDVWVRIAGLCLLILGYFYFNMGKLKYRPFLVLSTHTRSFQFAVFIAFVILGLVGPMILIASGIEFLSGAWTFLELKKET